MTQEPVRQGYSGSTVLLALLGGAVAGAAVALLTAPRSGRETRAKLTAAVRDTRDHIADAIKDGKEKVQHLPGAAKAAGTAARSAFVTAMREEA